MSVHVRFDHREAVVEGPRQVRRAATAGLCAVPGNQVPQRPRVRLVPSAGAVLRSVAWLPSGAMRGTVLLLQGRGDFIEKYFEVASDLLARGFAVVTFDWRGQGGSERLLPDPLKGHVDAFADYGHDLEAVVDHVLATLPRPWFALAHSMGAAVLLHALRAGDPWLDGAVVTAPMLALSPALAPVGSRALAYALDGVGLGKAVVPGPIRRGQASSAFQPDNLLTSDPVRYLRSYEILRAAPELGVGKPTIGWLRAAFDGMGSLRSDMAGVRTPVLAVAGDRDRVTHTPAAVRFAAGVETARALVIEGAAHDVMMERDGLRDRFWAAFDAFTAGDRALSASGMR